MKRRRIAPNPNVLDWRDEQMPVLRKIVKPWGDVVLEPLRPEQEQAFSHNAMVAGDGINWRDDPDYNIARPGARNLAYQLTTRRRQRK
jgi:hypothetical protein